MNVREARFIGVFAGLISGITSFEYNSLISLSIGSIGVLSFFMGKKVVKGTREDCWKA